MIEPVVTVIAADEDGEEARQLVDRIRDAWPGPTTPAIEHASASDPTVATGHAVPVLLLTDHVADALLEALADTAAASDRTLIVVGDGPRAEPWPPESFLPFASHVDPAILAAAIASAAHTQSRVDALRAEAELARRLAAGAQENVATFDEELRMAAMVQREFLPQSLPVMNEVRCGMLWRPANYLSGDIIDIRRLDERHLGVFLADVVGHGVGSALLTMIIVQSLKTKEIRKGSYRLLSPGETLTLLNKAMYERQGDVTRFATAVYAVIDTHSREVSISAAGHPPALHLHGDGVEQIDVGGAPLGIFGEGEFEETTFTLGDDDRFLLYSDGFEQAFPDPEQITSCGTPLPSTQYLDEFARLAEADDADSMIDRITARIEDGCGSLHQADDLSLIAVHAGRRAGVVPRPFRLAG